MSDSYRDILTERRAKRKTTSSTCPTAHGTPTAAWECGIKRGREFLKSAAAHEDMPVIEYLSVDILRDDPK